VVSSSQVNRTGILAKVRYTRVNQTYEFPIRVGDDFRDWRLLAVTSLGPPAASFLVLRYVVGPWSRWRTRVNLAKQQQEQAQELRQRYAKAAAEAALLAPVAARTAAAEAEKGGLVVLVAVYGALEGWPEALREEAAEELQQQQQSPRPDQQQTRDQQPQQQQLNGSHPAVSRANGPSSNEAEAAAAKQPMNNSSSSSQQMQSRWGWGRNQQQAAGAAADASVEPSSSSSNSAPQEATQQQPQQPWVDVTCPLQYLVKDGSLQLHPGITKVGLMGFADVALQQPRQLYVAYALGRQLYQVTVDDLDMLRVPGAGQVVEDPLLRRWLEGQLRYQQQPPQQNGSKPVKQVQ
jgi:hypothetical protein